MRVSSVDGIASVVGGLNRGWRVCWADFGIDRGLAFIVVFYVGFSEVIASSEDRLLRVIGEWDFWRVRWIRSRESS